MFPATITLHNPEQLAAVMALLYPTTAPAKPAAADPKPEAAKPEKAKPAGLTDNPNPTTVKEIVHGKKAEPAPVASEAQDLTGSKNGGQAVEALDNQHAKPQPAITFDQLKAKFVELGKIDNGRQKIVDVLARFGAQKLPALKPEFYDAASALIDTVMAGGEA